jgi:acylphosphatase
MAKTRPDAAAVTALTVYYTGRVQGVGFRATTERLAQGRAVTGWVRNLDDGRVELFVQGRGEAVDAFLAEIRRTFAANLRDIRVHPATPSPEWTAFSVRYD